MRWVTVSCLPTARTTGCGSDGNAMSDSVLSSRTPGYGCHGNAMSDSVLSSHFPYPWLWMSWKCDEWRCLVFSFPIHLAMQWLTVSCLPTSHTPGYAMTDNVLSSQLPIHLAMEVVAKRRVTVSCVPFSYTPGNAMSDSVLSSDFPYPWVR